MSHQDITEGLEHEEDRRGASLRPRGFDDFVGQDSVVRQLRVATRAATLRAASLDHVLLAGPPGLGKTSLAHIIAAELHVPLFETSGPALERAGDLAAILTNLPPRGVLFVDEVHRLPTTIFEAFYPAMEDFRIPVIVGEGVSASVLSVDLQPFTLIAATTRTGLLPAPLRDRFGIQFQLEHYDAQELAEIITSSAQTLGVEITPEAASLLGSCSRGTPRVANRLLRRVRDFADVHDVQIDEMLALEALTTLGIDARGLGALDRRILATLERGGEGSPVGIATLAALVEEEPGVIEDVHEPYLLASGLLLRTPRGRVITDLGREHLARVGAGR